MWSLEDCSVFFQIHARRHGFVLIRLGCSGFGRSQAGFWTVLGNVSSGATEEAKLVVKTALTFLGVSFPSFPSFIEMSGVVDFFCSEVEPLPWVEPELLFFCLELEEPLPDLLSDLLESDFSSDLFPEDLEAWVSWESSHSQYCVLIAWMGFWSPVRVVGLLWWTILSL